MMIRKPMKKRIYPQSFDLNQKPHTAPEGNIFWRYKDHLAAVAAVEAAIIP
ncbi:hypothetical protein [Serratia rubidaea]|uniref:hypothetical protein n=1 Tax=Serratia rubidaea TaxID=61652 RepID=UPI0022B8CB05|nr:hypothetical protein [Serratia rubidaea]WBF44395.1 hypothetical protein OLD77_17365 [Serratia rubidaea]